MSTEEHAREGAQAVIPDDEVVDVAVVRPRGSTLSGVLGAVAGVGVGVGGSSNAAWGVAGAMIGQRVNSSAKRTFPSIVLAVSPTRLDDPGRRTTGLVGGRKTLERMTHVERSHLAVAPRRHGTVGILELTGTTTGTTLEFELQAIGDLHLKEFLTTLDEKGQPAWPAL